MTMSIAHATTSEAPNLYSAAELLPGRSAGDLHRNALDHPAEILRLTGIRRGMRVADFLAGDGYFSELLSNVVGPGGRVLMINKEPMLGKTDRFVLVLRKQPPHH
ncbi:MAG: hypothetical protein KGJ52_02015 [Gammaproteobacteria bacterium]|nr:hypothetical protein [Gammaproteobacteria bacterium]